MFRRLDWLTNSGRGRVVFAAVAFAVFVAVHLVTTRDRCQLISYPPVTSPGGDGRSVISQQMECDARDGAKGDDFRLLLEDKGGRSTPIFRADLSPIVKWIDDRTLEISVGTVAKITLSEHQASGVDIRYIVPAQLMPGPLERRLAQADQPSGPDDAEIAKSRAFLVWVKANVAQ